ncbi:hypothetical protein J3R83DRAFT_13888 [Lanmaoa asiatica]|nr:hypothetical protein J3R83DRAFT_13888 [Lanmaoa asiatica]
MIIFALYFVPDMTRCHPRGVRIPCHSEERLMKSHISYRLLREEFQFLELQLGGWEHLSVFPQGLLLPIFAQDISEMVEEFQFFTRPHLHCLTRAHGLSFTLRYCRDALLDLLRFHRNCRCASVYMVFKRLLHSRQNVRVIHLAEPHLPEDIAASERLLRDEERRCLYVRGKTRISDVWQMSLISESTVRALPVGMLVSTHLHLSRI